MPQFRLNKMKVKTVNAFQGTGKGSPREIKQMPDLRQHCGGRETSVFVGL